MGYHHLALAAKDMKAIHDFYEGIMGFELVKVEIAPAPTEGGGWAKHFFYRMNGDDSTFIAFWELHDIPGLDDFETDLSKGAGVPKYINHIAFRVDTPDELERRRRQWTQAGLDCFEVDHNWCHSIYTEDPNGNLVEFCLTTGTFSEADREAALTALRSNDVAFSPPPAAVKNHKAPTAAE
jgi:catechol 2,3-dioxygenase-like lactoylglutathione lyase family enzyme